MARHRADLRPAVSVLDVLAGSLKPRENAPEYGHLTRVRGYANIST